ncbi:MAG: DUF4345 domain-containing protein [Henriciella sp.]|uniref:DUF4345 domain-containing protein n=1 Tax=Henriciella sp. TaxID=1968823 RepID=UPI003C78E2F6
MSRFLTRFALAGSGAILGLIGGALVVSPQAFLKSSGVMVEREPGLMSELTAPAGVLLMTGALMISGAVRLRFANAGLTAGAIVYGTYGAGRLVSMMLHGMPPQSLIIATLIEFGIAAVLAVLRMNSAPDTREQQAGRSFRDATV